LTVSDRHGVIGAAAYAGYLYVPVAYSAHTYQELMQHYATLLRDRKSPAWAVSNW
jgi:hypothetical protein